MTDRAIIRGRYVVGILLGDCPCRGITMTARAVINDTCMTEHCRGKGTGYVADTAILGSRKVAGMLFGHCPCRTISMTFITVTRASGMIKGTILEVGTDSMTCPTIRSGRWVRRSRVIRFS